MTVTAAPNNPSPARSDEGDIVRAAATALRDRRPLRHPRIRQAADAVQRGDYAEAEHLLTVWLEKHPDDARALHILAEAVLKLGRKEQAERLLARCTELMPEFEAGRFSYASTLYQRNRLDASLDQLALLLAADPKNILFLDLKAAVLEAMGRHRDAMHCRRELASEYPGSSELRVKYGKALRSVGEREGAIEAFRHAIALTPGCGSAWWSLADLKTWRFSDSDISLMESALAIAGKSERMYFHFALGRAYGDREEYAKSVEHYARGNAMKRLTITYDADWLSRQVAACRDLFTRELFASRAGSGADSAAPIFIVGLQRAGSTLVEQILGSHSAIQATAELPDITLMVEHLAETRARDGVGYPDLVAQLDAADLKALGESYLETTRFRRAPGRPFFVDKNPYNFLHVGLIRLILPAAKIIDVRRHPLACCWSNFSAHFESGALFAYRFNELGRAYADYLALMTHFDSALPGHVHRVIYEDLIENPETEIRRLLAHIGVPFEESCLAFHANARAMNSVSSEQVRQPLYSEAVDRWRHYEPWLGPLKTALGPALDHWRWTPLTMSQ